MHRFVRAVLSVAVVALLSAAARGSIVTFNCFPIDATQEVPPNASTGSGVGYCTLDTVTNLFSWNISYGGAGSTVTAPQFHNATTGVNGPVIIPLTPGSPIIGSATVTPAQAAQIQAGQWYFNVHTTMNPGGELRGQVVNANCNLLAFRCFPISALQEVPPSASTGTGVGTCTLNTATREFSWNISYEGLTGAPTAMHFHVAPSGMNGPILVPLPVGSPAIGSMFVTPTQATQISTGQWYFNVHTLAFPGGELRGQIVDSGCAQWADLGNSLDGVSGDPLLLGIGTMKGGSTNAVNLLNAAPAASSTLFVGISQINAPFKGGVLVPSPT